MGKGEVSSLRRGESLSMIVPPSDEPQQLMLGVLAGAFQDVSVSTNGRGHYSTKPKSGIFHCRTCNKGFRSRLKMMRHKIKKHDYHAINQHKKKA